MENTRFERGVADFQTIRFFFFVFHELLYQSAELLGHDASVGDSK